MVRGCHIVLGTRTIPIFPILREPPSCWWRTYKPSWLPLGNTVFRTLNCFRQQTSTREGTSLRWDLDWSHSSRPSEPTRSFSVCSRWGGWPSTTRTTPAQPSDPRCQPRTRETSLRSRYGEIGTRLLVFRLALISELLRFDALAHQWQGRYG